MPRAGRGGWNVFMARSVSRMKLQRPFPTHGNDNARNLRRFLVPSRSKWAAHGFNTHTPVLACQRALFSHSAFGAPARVVVKTTLTRCSVSIV